MLGLAARACGAARGMGAAPRRLPPLFQRPPHVAAAANSTLAPCSLHIDPAHVVQPLHSIDFPKEVITNYVWQDVNKWQDKVAVECGLTGRRLTYAQLRDASRRLAVALRSPSLLGPWQPSGGGGAHGQGPSQAAVVMSNAPEFAVVLMGALEAGIVLSTSNPNYTSEEIARQLVDCGAQLVFMDAASSAAVTSAVKQMKGPRPRLVLAGPGDLPAGTLRLEELIGPDVPLGGGRLWEEDPGALCLMPYSSGTTGLPKGVLLTQQNIACNIRQLHHPSIFHTREAHGDFQEKIPVILPMFHIYGMVVVLMSSLIQGAHLITLPRFQPDTFINTMINYKATMLFLAPPLLLFLGSDKAPAAALSSVRFTMSGAAPLGAKDVERFKARAPPGIMVMQGYGMTESSPVVLHGHPGNPVGVGKPVASTEAVVVDLETGRSLPPTTKGELCFRGSQIMQGYWQRPEDTAATLAKDGWLRSGDIGCMDDTGDFIILDRAKELIKVKGFQVAPAELEELLRAQEGVADAAVVGVSDERAGELPMAFVVPRPAPADAAAAAALRQRLADSVASRVAAHKRLAGGVRLVADIPKNPSGKILRRHLRANPPPEIVP